MGPEPAWPFLAPGLPNEDRRVRFLKGESDDGGLLDVVEV